MVGENLEGKTLQNSSIALVTTVVLHFIPGVNVIGPIVGGFLGGYLQHEGVTGGIKIGGLKGLFMIVPAFPLALIVGGLLNDIPILGALAAGGTIILALIVVGHSLVFGIFGGILAGVALYFVDAAQSDDRGSAVQQSNNIRTESDGGQDTVSTAESTDGDIRGRESEESTGGDDRQLR